jgi:hypothetical protein
MTTPGNEGGVYDIKPGLAQEFELKPGAYVLLTAREVVELPMAPRLVKGVIRVGEFCVVYGDPGCGKTFVVIDLSLKIATGREWFGRKTRKGRVVYLAGEGAGGLGRRIRAWIIEHKEELDNLDLRVLPHSIALMNRAEFDRLIETLSELEQKPVLVVIDTLARYMLGGDENSAQDMGVFINRCAAVAKATGAAVIVIHHKRKGNAAERGSSALRGAADVMIEVTRDENLIEVVGDKSKDDAPLPTLYLKTKSLWLGNDEDNEPVTSLVVLQGEPPADAATPVAAQLGQVEHAQDNGAVIRRVLATLFNGRASGGSLRSASGLKKTTHHEALEAEIKAGRIITEGGRYPIYALTPLASEYRSPSPSPGESADSSGLPDQSSRESESESTPTLKGGDSTADSDSRIKSDKTAKRRGKKAKPKPVPEDPSAEEGGDADA